MASILLRSLHSRGLSPAGVWNGVARLFDRGFDWLEKQRQLRQLAGLDEHLLKDIGVSRADVWRELHDEDRFKKI